jgi:hypothetical protein
MSSTEFLIEYLQHSMKFTLLKTGKVRSYGGGAAQIIAGRVSSSTPMAAIDVIILWLA